eukprot:14629196-Alexandrium_andersonii.AAC.1
MAVQETRTPGTTQFVANGHLFVLVASGEQKEYAGVGYIINLKVRKAITFVDCRGGRMAALGVNTGPRELVLLNVYAPQAARPFEERQHFYDELWDFTDSLETRGVLVYLGDWNARLRHRESEDVVGPWHFVASDRVAGDEGSTNEELLVQFCIARDLVLPSSWMQRPQDKMVTYRAPGVNEPPGRQPDPAKFAEIDFYVLPRRWASSLRSCSSDAKSPLNSDHFP